MKYIIDIPKTVGMLEKVGSVHYTYFDGIQVQTIVMKSDEIEELNSDYINEHFGELQDTAYQKGFEDGKKEAESSEVIEQAKVDAFNKGMLHKGEKIHDAYQRGLHEGNDIGYKDGFEDGKAVNDKGCEGCKYAEMGSDTTICAECCNAYHNQWTAEQTDDRIEVGDEVEVLNSGNKYLIAWFAGTSICGFAHDGVTCRLQPSDVRKTGRHFDIASILEDMKHD